MNKFYLIKTGAVLASLLLLVSCDPQTCGTAYITNKSSDTVEIVNIYNGSEFLAPEATQTIGPRCGRGTGVTPTSMDLMDTLRRDTILCKKDIRNDKNWMTTKISRYNYEHRFVITDQDF